MTVYLKNRDAKPLKSKEAPLLAGMDAETFTVSDYITHLGFSSDHVMIITRKWLTVFRGFSIFKSSQTALDQRNEGKTSMRPVMNNFKKNSSALPSLLLALPLHSIVTVESSNDGQDVLFTQGHSSSATKYRMKVGSIEIAANIVQRVNHLRAEFQFFM